MTIVQVLPTVAFGDAVSNDALAIGKLLAKNGHETAMYAENIDARLPGGLVRRVDSLGRLGARDILLYHASTGTKLNYDLPRYGGVQAMIYHNITPPAFFARYSPQSAALTREGYEGIRHLAGKVSYCIADSSFNKQNLEEMGYGCPIDVCPIMIPFDDYAKQPSKRVLDRYGDDGYTNILFVGRIAPNKKQEDVIRAFCCYQRDYNPRSRLFLVGNYEGLERYHRDLRDYTELLGIRDKVIFTGHIKFDEILAYYHLAHAFLCMSEHEGFCVPLVEAMLFKLPVVAYASCAIPETLGEGGLLLEDKDPAYAAAVIDRVVRDEDLRGHVLATQARQLASFDYEVVARRFLACIDTLTAMGE